MTAERSDRRVALQRDVVLQLPDRPQRLTASSANISATGMFVRSPDLQPAGRTLSFELSLGRRHRSIRGEGEVVWSRQFNLGPELPAGMGIRFLRLDDSDRRTVRAMIGYRAEESAADAAPGRPLSGLTSSQQQKLHGYAGCAAAKPERPWSKPLHGLLSMASGVARRLMIL